MCICVVIEGANNQSVVHTQNELHVWEISKYHCNVLKIGLYPSEPYVCLLSLDLNNTFRFKMVGRGA